MSQPSPGNAPTILLVEDDDQVREFIRSLLANNGYQVVEARTGAEGLQAAENIHHKIDLLLSDMLLPEVSGSELAEKLRERIPHLKIVFVSGYIEGDIVQNAIQEWGAVFLDKPFAPSVLLDRVREALKSAPATA